MADKDLGDGDGPSLEMPSLGSLFKRKKKQAPEQDDSLTPTAEELNAVVRGERPSKAAQEQEPDVPDGAEPGVAQGATTPAETEPTAVEEGAADHTTSGTIPVEPTEPDEPTEPVEPDEPDESDESDEPVEATGMVAPVAEANDEPGADPIPDVPADDEPTAVVPVLDDEPDAEQTAVLTGVGGPEEPGAEQVEAVTDEPRAAAAQGTAEDDAAPLFADEVDDETAPDLEDPDEDEDDGDDDETVSSAKRQFALPPLPGRVAAVTTGLVIGVLAVAMTYLSIQGCEQVKGTSTCGTPGFFLLIAIMILLVVLGSALLGAWKVADPGSTSFLAVGLLAVIALLFLVRVIFSPWMIVVIPVVAVVTFTASHWLTSLFVDEVVEEEEVTHA